MKSSLALTLALLLLVCLCTSACPHASTRHTLRAPSTRHIRSHTHLPLTHITAAQCALASASAAVPAAPSAAAAKRADLAVADQSVVYDEDSDPFFTNDLNDAEDTNVDFAAEEPEDDYVESDPEEVEEVRRANNRLLVALVCCVAGVIIAVLLGVFLYKRQKARNAITQLQAQMYADQAEYQAPLVLREGDA